MSKWIKLADQKPQDGQRVLVFNEKYAEAAIQVYDADDSDFELYNGNYWCPIPDDPKED